MTTATKSIRALDLSSKREVITLPELGVTIDERLIGGDSKRIRHYDFIMTLAEMLDKRNMRNTPEDLHLRVGGPSQMPNITLIQNEAKKYDVESPVEAHLIRNLAGKIQIHELADEYSNQALAFTYSQLGIQVAFGMNVFVCSNMCIWGEHVIQSYGKSGHSIKEIFSIVGDWMDLYEQKRAVDRSYMDRLQAIDANHNDILRLMGEFLVEANKKNMKNLKDDAVDVAPLNDTQVSAFAQEYIRKQRKIDSFPVENMWDVYNIATSLLRPDRVNNFEPILRQNKVLGDFMTERYKLN